MISGTSVKIGRDGSHGVYPDAESVERWVDPAWMVR